MQSLELLTPQPIEPLASEQEWAAVAPTVRKALGEIRYFDVPGGKTVMLSTNDFHKLLTCVFLTPRFAR